MQFHCNCGTNLPIVTNVFEAFSDKIVGRFDVAKQELHVAKIAGVITFFTERLPVGHERETILHFLHLLTVSI